ncbi:uncharacterized protein LOC135688960 [Rhopilema esculentum]|uniref:uncharacterized protein LOC135688960 n=1 Tax=Rhopilema esculentum TaxID=499914 RepID=UPI0031DC82FF
MFWRFLFCYHVCLLLLCNATSSPRKDLVIILDCSKSISRNTYSHDINFLKNLVNHLSISPSSVRVAMVTFASEAKIEFNFEQYVNRECVLKRLKKIQRRPRKGRTNIDAALRKAVYLFKSYQGFAKDKEIYLISDGKFNEGKYPDESLKTLKKLGVKIQVLAVGKNPDFKELRAIASISGRDDFNRLKNDRKTHKNVIFKLAHRKEPYTKCKKSGTILDECNRECQCSNGFMKNCQRVRREFTTFTDEEKKRYLQAYFKITTVEPLKSRFIKFIRKHANLFWLGIHKRYQFFPWHRWYVYQFENLMREVDCRITVPFWDWSYWSPVAWKVGVHIWTNDEYGFGGDGKESRQYCVQTGPFNESGWSHPAPEKIEDVLSAIKDVTGQCQTPVSDSTHYKRCLRRSFNSECPNVANVLRTIGFPCTDFKRFDNAVREDYHNDLHNEIGGQMSSNYAANAPEFFLHHGLLDNIWYRWQMKGPACQFAYFPKNVSKLLDAPFKTTDFVNSSNQGHCVSVKYDKFLERVIPAGTDVGEPNHPEQPSCSEDAESKDEMPKSAFTLLKEQMRNERDDD